MVYWKWRTPIELEAAKQKGEWVARCVPFTSSVFNLDQIEGVERPKNDVLHHGHERLEIADQLLGVMPNKPEVSHGLGNQPVYHGDADRILLPHLSQFESADAYFGDPLSRTLSRHGSSNPIGPVQSRGRQSD